MLDMVSVKQRVFIATDHEKRRHTVSFRGTTNLTNVGWPHAMLCRGFTCYAMAQLSVPCHKKSVSTFFRVMPCHNCFVSCRVKILTYWDHLEYDFQDFRPTGAI